jgi:hypothetical protein
MNANITTSTAQIILRGQTPKFGYAYEIKQHLKGHKDQYFVLTANVVTLNGLTFPTIRHTSKSLSYIKKWVGEY